MNPLTRAWQWLITKETKETKMSESVNDGTVVDQNTAVQEVKTGVKDFEKAFSFVGQGIALLGDAAKDELMELAKKYL